MGLPILAISCILPLYTWICKYQEFVSSILLRYSDLLLLASGKSHCCAVHSCLNYI